MAGAYLETAEDDSAVFPLKEHRSTAGSAECDIVISNPTVSRCHAMFEKNATGWIVEDLRSTNGTWVNGRKVKRCLFANGDHLSLGNARFFFSDGSAPLHFAPKKTRADERPITERILALSSYEFEKLTGELFLRLGFESIVTKQSGDGGVDVMAVNHGAIFRGRYLIQCKRYGQKNKVTRPEVTAFFGRIASEPGAKGIFITSSTFTRGAREFAASTGINLMDGQELEKLVLRHHLL